ncbi:M23 family metallopeptidase [Microbacterium gilvum]|uniref:M23ase beta-sheet core domain-containing protein n=1 Tax=Microbacterium gilvum TaxID=1336204 RepID=A0ABP8ZQP9_9MICO
MGKILWPNGKTIPPNFSAEGHFGERNSTAPGASKYHRGLDMWGIGIVRAIADGIVVAVGWGAGFGWGGGYQVWIQHDGFFSRSLHLVTGSSSLRVGDRVFAGDRIGVEGMTGAYQVHLHLEITPGQWHARNDGQIDPKAWLYAHVGGSSAAPADSGAPTNTNADGSSVARESEEDAMSTTDHRFYRHQKDGRIFVVAGARAVDLNEADAKKLIDIQRLNHRMNPDYFLPAPDFKKPDSFFNLDQAGWNLLRAVYPPRS